MSRIWKSPITIPAWVSISNNERIVKVKWPKWELSFEIKDFVNLEQTDTSLTVSIKDENDSFQKGVWGLTRTLIWNMVTWVTAWFEKSLEIIWVWYKFEVIWTDKLTLSVGFSHKVDLTAPEWVTLALDPSVKNTIIIKWIDKQLVWFFAAKVRSIKKPEPYKGKWIRYSGEYVRRKAWKTWGKK
ncbi:MAG: 50S ribosomal protein L6 [uncultured bacterium (gcode 4)]|uniref:50S ribosomal protein L6 n=1 Tax=uncultured bacterium (gcode 4) TaxID=1234023 RepID=K2FSR8_9BACT|nr:MAG: 50S ribosomal protein L6 [uncultured bacterium (gcode 4)]